MIATKVELDSPYKEDEIVEAELKRELPFKPFLTFEESSRNLVRAIRKLPYAWELKGVIHNLPKAYTCGH